MGNYGSPLVYDNTWEIMEAHWCHIKNTYGVGGRELIYVQFNYTKTSQKRF